MSRFFSKKYSSLSAFTPDADEYEPDCCDESSAVNFIVESARKYGKELTVIALGPFTNLAKAALTEAEVKFVQKAQSVVASYRAAAEQNEKKYRETAEKISLRLNEIETALEKTAKKRKELQETLRLSQICFNIIEGHAPENAGELLADAKLASVRDAHSPSLVADLPAVSTLSRLRFRNISESSRAPLHSLYATRSLS